MTSPLAACSARPGLWQRARFHTNAWLRVAVFVLLYKTALLTGIWAAARALPWLFSTFRFHLYVPGEPSPGLWRYFETWDAYHYLNLAQNGYANQTASLAFYPFWPFLVRAAAPLFGGNSTLAALVLANLLSTFALVMVHRLVARRFDEAVAHRTLVLLLIFPGSLFLCLPYTESLFLLLCVALFGLLERAPQTAPAPNKAPSEARASWQLPLGVALCAMGAAFARPTGVFLCVPLLYVAWLRRDTPVWWVVAGAPVLGILGYFGVIYGATGDFAAGLKAQQMFPAHASLEQMLDVPRFVRGFFDLDPARGPLAMPLDRLWFVLFAATLWPLWKRDKTWFAFALVMGLVPAMTVSLMSYMRYLSVVFPCFVVMALWLDGPRGKRAFPFVVALLLPIQIFLVMMQINFYWVS